MVSTAGIVIIIIVIILVIVGVSLGLWLALRSKPNNTTQTQIFITGAGATCTLTTFTKYQTYTSAYVLKLTIPSGTVVGVDSGYVNGSTSRLPSGNEIAGTDGVGIFDYFIDSDGTLTVYYPVNFRDGTILPNALISSTNTTKYPLYIYYLQPI